jgi:hypothetical protein
MRIAQAPSQAEPEAGRRGERFIVVHSLEQARSALGAAQALALPLTLASAAGAGGYAGPLWFKSIIDTAAAEFPEVRLSAVLDCGDEAGTALAALRHGLRRIRVTGSPAAAERLADIAGQLGAVIERGELRPALDLLDCRDFEASCRAFLAGNSGSV